jgi:hypothetical protein
MRTLKLTHEQILVIEEALNTGIYTRQKLRDDIQKSSILSPPEIRDTMKPILEVEEKMNKLLTEIQGSDLDV